LTTTEISYHVLGRDTENNYYIQPGKNASYQIAIPTSGYWYLQVFVCSGKVSVSTADSRSALDKHEVAQVELGQDTGRRQYFVRRKVDNSDPQYVVVHAKEAMKELGDDEANVIVASSWWWANQKEYNLVKKGDEESSPQIAYRYAFAYRDSMLSVTMKPAEIEGLSNDEAVTYYLRLCPKGAIRNRGNLCVFMNNTSDAEDMCQHHSTRYLDKDKKDEGHQIVMEGVLPGDYDLHVFAVLSIGDSWVRSYAWEPMDVDVREPFLTRIWDLLVMGVSIAAALLCMCCIYMKMIRKARDAGYNVRVTKTDRSYGFVGDDEEDEEHSPVRSGGTR